MRKVIDKPMLRIKDVSGYADDVNEVVTDFLERLRAIREGDGLIPDLERELFNWSLESKICGIFTMVEWLKYCPLTPCHNH